MTQLGIERRRACVGPHVLSWLQCGSAASPPALFLHGIPASAELWREVLPLVAAQGWLCLAPDLPGYGETLIAPGGSYGLGAGADLLLQWLNQEGYEYVWLIGHDIGGGVAQLMLTRSPAHFGRVTLSNCITADTWPVPSVKVMIWLARLRLFAPLAKLKLFPNFIAHRELRRAVYRATSLTSERMRRIFWDGKVTSSDGRKAFEKMLRALDSSETLRNMPALARVGSSVHLLWAESDPNQPWAGPGQILAQTWPDSSVTKLEQAGHFLQIDDPQSYVDALIGAWKPGEYLIGAPDLPVVEG